MPEHLRALVVVLVLSAAVFGLAKAPITARACSEPDFLRRRNVWFALTLTAFLAHNFWVFVVVASCTLVLAVRAEQNRFALYLGLVLALPYLSASIRGFGIVNQLFEVDQLRLLSLVILFPTYLSLRRQPGVEPFGRLICDKLLLCYLGLSFALMLPHVSLTTALRESVLYAFTDTFLIYYVASRSLRTVKAFRDALGAFIVGAMVFSLVIAFEFWGHWLLYAAVDEALGADGQNATYLRRAGLLRAVATSGQAIVAGYTCAIAMGLYFYVRTLVPNAALRHLGLVLLIVGLIGAVSRAPWLGAAAMVVVFIVLGPTPVSSMAKLALPGLAVLPILLSTDAGAFIVDLLPWIGSVEARNVEGREHLAAVSLQVIRESPFFGRYDFAAVPAIEALRGNDGIIDLVNTYIIIALRGGGVSLALFAGIIAVAIFGVAAGLRKIREKRDERHTLGRSLLATLLGVVFIIGTVSPIFFVYPLLWSLVGLCVGYMCLIERGEARSISGAPAA